jgi:hypothetical protein
MGGYTYLDTNIQLYGGKMVKKIYMLFLFALAAVVALGILYGDNVVTTADIENNIPTASSAMLNGASDITLDANTTTMVFGSVTIYDVNGCEDIRNVTGTLFRTNVSGGHAAPDDNRSHYSTNCMTFDCDGPEDFTSDYLCIFYLSHYADPTDAGSIYEGTNWTFNATPSDEEGGVSDTAQQDVESLSSLQVTASSVDFGVIPLGGNTSDVNPNTSIQNTGNEGIDILLSAYGSVPSDGYSMNCTAGAVDAGMMEYASAPFTYGSGTDMSASDTELDIDIPVGTDAEPRPSGTVYYGLAFPLSGIAGRCNGTIVITAQSDPNLD